MCLLLRVDTAEVWHALWLLVLRFADNGTTWLRSKSSESHLVVTVGHSDEPHHLNNTMVSGV